MRRWMPVWWWVSGFIAFNGHRRPKTFSASSSLSSQRCPSQPSLSLACIFTLQRRAGRCIPPPPLPPSSLWPRAPCKQIPTIHIPPRPSLISDDIRCQQTRPTALDKHFISLYSPQSTTPLCHHSLLSSPAPPPTGLLPPLNNALQTPHSFNLRTKQLTNEQTTAQRAPK